MLSTILYLELESRIYVSESFLIFKKIVNLIWLIFTVFYYNLGKDEFELEWNDEVDEYNPADFGIQLVSHPMNYTDSQFDKELLYEFLWYL